MRKNAQTNAHKIRKKRKPMEKCANHSDTSLIILPYAAKLLLQELLSMTITPRIITENSTFN